MWLNTWLNLLLTHYFVVIVMAKHHTFVVNHKQYIILDKTLRVTELLDATIHFHTKKDQLMSVVYTCLDIDHLHACKRRPMFTSSVDGKIIRNAIQPDEPNMPTASHENEHA